MSWSLGYAAWCRFNDKPLPHAAENGIISFREGQGTRKKASNISSFPTPFPSLPNMWVMETEKRGERLLPALPDHPELGLRSRCSLAHALTCAQRPWRAEMRLLPLHCAAASSPPTACSQSQATHSAFPRPPDPRCLAPVPHRRHAPRANTGPRTPSGITPGPTATHCLFPAHATPRPLLPCQKPTSMSMTFPTP